MRNQPIYLDNNATTPVDPLVLEAMLPYFRENFANASSTHQFGSLVKTKLNIATETIAELLNAEREEIIYTSGATESINLVLKGIAYKYDSTNCHIITAITEHKATLDVCDFLETHGYEITYLGVDHYGLIDLEELKSNIKNNTRLISVMMANNETGVLQPITSIGEMAKSKGILFHTDATQAFGKVDIDVHNQNIDLLSFSGHKIYGPKGIGGLFISEHAKSRLQPLIHGGGQQYNLRSGTYNSPGIIGLGMAAMIAYNQLHDDIVHTSMLRDQLEMQLLELPNTFVNGDPKFRLPNTTNICFEGLDSDVLISSTFDLAVSNGSACTAATPEPSYVLMEMGLTKKQAFSSLRISVGRFNTEDEIVQAIEILKNKINQQRKVFEVA